LNLNFSLNKNNFLSTIKNPSNPNFTSKNSFPQSGTMGKIIKANFESGKRNQLKTKSFDRNNCQANLTKNNSNKPKSSNFVNESCLSKNNAEFYEGVNNRNNSKDKNINFDNKNQTQNLRNFIDVINFNKDFKEFTNDINKKLLSNFYSDNGLNLLGKDIDLVSEQKIEAEEKQIKKPNNIRIASANFKNEIFSINKTTKKNNN